MVFLRSKLMVAPVGFCERLGCQLARFRRRDGERDAPGRRGSCRGCEGCERKAGSACAVALPSGRLGRRKEVSLEARKGERVDAPLHAVVLVRVP